MAGLTPPKKPARQGGMAKPNSQPVRKTTNSSAPAGSGVSKNASITGKGMGTRGSRLAK